MKCFNSYGVFECKYGSRWQTAVGKWYRDVNFDTSEMWISLRVLNVCRFQLLLDCEVQGIRLSNEGGKSRETIEPTERRALSVQWL